MKKDSQIKLTNEFKKGELYIENREQFQTHLLDQYKTYVEMADNISARRNLSNVFFLTLNSIVIGAIGFLFEKIKLVSPRELIIFPIAAVVILCTVWLLQLFSYNQLNAAKYNVIGEIEKSLPINPYKIEWEKLGLGVDKSKYIPITKLETIVPIIFMFMYISIAIYVIFLMQ